MLRKNKFLITIGFIITCLCLSGCGMFSPAPKPDIGPAGKPVESKPNPPVTERFQSPPAEIYDLEALAGAVFEGINKQNWPEASGNFAQMQTTWLTVKSSVGEKKGVKEGDEAIQKLSTALSESNILESYESLNKFMGSVSDIGKSYKLSPIAEIIAIGNSIRSVSFYVQANNWPKASSKVKELESTWQHSKPALEQAGVLGEATKIHSRVNQLKSSVTAETKGSSEEHIASLNESMSIMRQFYRGK